MLTFFAIHNQLHAVLENSDKSKRPLISSKLLWLCAAIFCIAINALFSRPAYSAPGPLHIENNSIYTQDNNKFYMKGININDYMDFLFSPCGEELTCFDEILSWLHTEEDYARIKAMGFNIVRLNLGEQHFIDHLQRIRDHVQWAKNNNLYIILTYFAPPGSIACDGNYNELPFWHCIMDSGKSCEYRKRFIQEWEAIFAEFQNEPHVLYELLNEPQIGSERSCTSSQFCIDNPSKCVSISSSDGLPLYVDLIKDITEKLVGYGEHILILDGLSYASATYRDFSFIPDIASTYPSLAYTFHYYMSDIAWKGSSVPGKAFDPFRNITRPFTTENPGVKTISFEFTPSVDFAQPETRPFLRLISLNQRGTYSIRSVIIKDTDDTVVFKSDFADTVLAKYDYSSGTYVIPPSSGTCNDDSHPPEPSQNCSLLLLDNTDRTRSWTLIHSGMLGSASASLISRSADIVSISNTMDRGNGANAVIDLRAFIPETDAGHYTDHPYPISLNPNKKYRVQLVVNGDSIDDNGSLTIVLYSINDNIETVLFHKVIRNVCGAAENCIEEPLSSHPERIYAAFATVKELSEQYNAPFFLGEFGVPLTEREPNAIDYYTVVTSAAQAFSGWNLYKYRDHITNLNGSECEFCSDYITFGLFSGWGATVESMMWPLPSPDLSNILGTSLYYFRPDFISAIEVANRKMTQAITFDPLGDMTADDTGITLSATASSTLPVTFRSLTPAVCSVEGTVLTLSHSAGICTIRAYQEGDTNYYAALPVPQSFNVASGVLDHFILSQIGSQFVASPFGITVTAKDAHGNTVTGYTSTVTLSTTAGTINPTISDRFIGGMWTGGVVVSGAGNGKTITASDTSSSKRGESNAFTVDKAAQTIMVPDAYRAPASAAYGSAFVVRAAATSGLPVAITSSGSCSGSGRDGAVITMTGSSGVCTVHYSQGGDGNYDAAPQVASETAAKLAYVMRISGPTAAFYSNLQSALGAAGTGDEIRIQQALPPDQVVDFDPPATIAITLQGGYEADFASQSSFTTVRAIIIRKATITVDHLVIQ